MRVSCRLWWPCADGAPAIDPFIVSALIATSATDRWPACPRAGGKSWNRWVRAAPTRASPDELVWHAVEITSRASSPGDISGTTRDSERVLTVLHTCGG